MSKDNMPKLPEHFGSPTAGAKSHSKKQVISAFVLAYRLAFQCKKKYFRKTVQLVRFGNAVSVEVTNLPKLPPIN